MVKIKKIFYEKNGNTFVATGVLLSEDEHFITINDRFEGEVSIGKRYIMQILDVEQNAD